MRLAAVCLPMLLAAAEAAAAGNGATQCTQVAAHHGHELARHALSVTKAAAHQLMAKAQTVMRHFRWKLALAVTTSCFLGTKGKVPALVTEITGFCMRWNIQIAPFLETLVTKLSQV